MSPNNLKQTTAAWLPVKDRNSREADMTFYLLTGWYQLMPLIEEGVASETLARCHYGGCSCYARVN